MNKLIALSICSIVSLTAMGQSRSFTLSEAQDYALTHSLQAKASRLDVVSAQATVRQTTAIGLPQISGTINYQEFIDIPTSLIPAEFFGGEPGEFAEVQFGTKYNASGELNASQLIFDGSYIVGLKAAKVYSKLAAKSHERTEREIKATVAETYYLILVAEENLSILKKTYENIEQSVFEISKLYEAGFVEETEKDQIQLTLNQVKTNIDKVERQVKLAYDLFRYQLGIDLQTEIALTDNLEGVMSSLNPELLMSRSLDLEQHVDFQLAQTQTNLQKLNFRKEQVANLPSIALFASHTQNAQRNQFNFGRSDKEWYPTTVYGFTMNIPIFSSGSRYQTSKLARISWEKAMLEEEMMRENLKLQEKQSRDNFLNAVSSYQNEEKNINLALKIFNTSLIKYREGLITGLDLSQAQNQLLQVQSSYINSILTYLQSKTAFEKAINAL